MEAGTTTASGMMETKTVGTRSAIANPQREGKMDRILSSSIMGSPAENADEEEPVIVAEVTFQRRSEQPGAIPIVPNRPSSDCVEYNNVKTQDDDDLEARQSIARRQDNDAKTKTVQYANDDGKSSAFVVSADLVDEERERQRDEAVAAVNMLKSSITVDAELVDDDELPDDDSHKHYRKRIIAAVCFFMVALVVGILILVAIKSTANTNDPLTTEVHQCFQSSTELQAAASQFLSASTENDESKQQVMATYGFTIGSWCVSQVTSFQHLFDVSSVFAASFYNEPISQWNTSSVTDMSWMFFNATSYNQSMELWHVSSATDLTGMFSDATSYNQPMSLWDTSSVTGMSHMFDGAGSYNQPMSSWDTSSVTTMGVMFQDAISYNQPISEWNTSQVTVMYGMFWGAKSYNQPMSLWDTSQVTNMRNMFQGATSYNQPMSSWNTSSVTHMLHMFDGATNYNQPMSSWITSSVMDMSYVFHGAESFNQELNAWDVSSVTSMKTMFAGATSFDQDLSGWSVAKVSDMSSMFEGASRFNQNLCSWGKLLPPNANVKSMFAATSCITVEDPNLAADPPGPFCHPCS